MILKKIFVGKLRKKKKKLCKQIRKIFYNRLESSSDRFIHLFLNLCDLIRKNSQLSPQVSSHKRKFK